MTDRRPITPRDFAEHVADAFGPEDARESESPELSAALASLGDEIVEPSDAASASTGRAVKTPADVEERLGELELQVSLVIGILDELRSHVAAHIEQHTAARRFRLRLRRG